ANAAGPCEGAARPQPGVLRSAPFKTPLPTPSSPRFSDPIPPAVTGACFACGTPHDLATLQTVCRACGLPIRVDHALDASTMPRAAVAGRTASMWRYREVLPGADDPVTLVEGATPLLEVGPDS